MAKTTVKEIELTAVIQAIKEEKKNIAIRMLIIMLIALLYALFATKIYTANIIINPPPKINTNSGDSVSALLGVPSFFEGGVSNFVRTDADMSMVMLKTREVEDLIVTKFNLAKYYKVKNAYLARLTLDHATTFISDRKSGFLTINVADTSPEMASKIANFYVVALGSLISRMNLDQVLKKKSFFEAQVATVHAQLAKSQSNLTNFAKTHGITAGVQAGIMTNISTQLQGELVVAQSELQNMNTYATIDNPDYKQLQARIASLKAQIVGLSGTQNDSINSNIVIPANLAPTLAQEYLDLMQDVAFHEMIYNVFMKQYELSKISWLSNLEPVTVQVIDRADIPQERSSPKRTLIMLVTFVLSIILNLIYVVLRNHKKIFINIVKP